MSDNTFKPTWLYIKIHTKTGLRYFGKTTRKFPFRYNGSGKHWVAHINKHGKEFVETTWSELFTDASKCNKFALNFSIKNDIVNSEKWANLMLEDGLGLSSFGRILSQETKKKISEKNKGRKYSTEINRKKARKGKENGMYGIRRFGTMSPHYNKPHTVETKEKMKIKALLQPKIICPHCNFECNKINASRWHFDNCKLNKNNTIKNEICPYCGKIGRNNMKRYHFENCKLRII